MQRILSIVNTVLVLGLWALVYLPESILLKNVTENKVVDIKTFGNFFDSKYPLFWIAISLFIIFSFTDINFLAIVPALLNAFVIVTNLFNINSVFFDESQNAEFIYHIDNQLVVYAIIALSVCIIITGVLSILDFIKKMKGTNY